MKTTCFERAIFFSWYCGIRDCKYCFMSTQKNVIEKGGVRSLASLLAEVILIKNLKWDFGFFSGGINAYTKTKFKEVLKKVYQVYGKKIWINVGPLTKKELIEYKNYIKGVVGSIETVNKKIHHFVCPSKPIEPYLKMFKEASKLKLKKAITIILGLGETINAFKNLQELIKKYNISKIHIYGLNPQKGTIFENAKAPNVNYQAEWIKKLRKEFPKINIQCGIWSDRPDYISTLLEAGANSISKFPVIKRFNSKEAQEIERQARLAGRKFIGSLTKLPKVNWNKKVDKLKLENDLKSEIKLKLKQYLKVMQKSKK